MSAMGVQKAFRTVSLWLLFPAYMLLFPAYMLLSPGISLCSLRLSLLWSPREPLTDEGAGAEVEGSERCQVRQHGAQLQVGGGRAGQVQEAVQRQRAGVDCSPVAVHRDVV